MQTELFVFVMLSLASGALFCQQPPTVAQMKQMLDASQHRGQLGMEGTAPFHLVASFQEFGEDGKPAGKGTMDELWEGPTQYKETLVLPAMKQVMSKDGNEGFEEVLSASPRELIEVDNGTQAWRTGEWVLSGQSGNAIDAVLQPFVLRSNTSNRLSWETARNENADLDCIGTEPDIPGVADDTRLALTTYCLNPGNHLLRLIYRPNKISISFNDVEPFEKKYIARSIAVGVDGKVQLKLHIDVLEAASDFSSLNEPPPGTAQLLHFHRAEVPYLSGEVMTGQLLKSVDLKSGMTGRVIVKIHVDITGAVESAEVVSGQNSVAQAPLLEAVKQWRYRASYQGNKLVPVDKYIDFAPRDGQPSTSNRYPLSD
jgi:TonB family protein